MSPSPVRTPLLTRLYRQYLNDRDAEGFAALVSRWYTAGTLMRLVAHPLREVRRAAVLALGRLADYQANAVLGCALSDEDRTVRRLAEEAIRAVWPRAGTEPQRQLLCEVIRLNASGAHTEAIQRATVLLEKAPQLAEAWYQRATAQFHLDHMAEAIRDCHEALEINPYHFPAAVTMGQAYLELGNHVSALECFRRALRLYPDLEAVRAQVVRLARMVEDR